MIEYRGPRRRRSLPALASELVRSAGRLYRRLGGPAPSSPRRPRPNNPDRDTVGTDDPVTLGLDASLARPGANAPGSFFRSGELAAKQLELLRSCSRRDFAMLLNPANIGNSHATARRWRVPPPAWDVNLQVSHAGTPAATSKTPSRRSAREPPTDALFVAGGPFLLSRRMQTGPVGGAPRAACRLWIARICRDRRA